MNTRPKLIQDGICCSCSRDVSYCRCTVEDIHDWLEDQYMLPMTALEFGAANPIPVVGDSRYQRRMEDEADNLGVTEVAEILCAITDDKDHLARDLVGG
jgi:hypothetical protein